MGWAAAAHDGVTTSHAVVDGGGILVSMGLGVVAHWACMSGIVAKAV
jgi:hypothetical protein